MNKILLIVATVAALFFVVVSCTDDTTKVGLDSQPVRVEYSKCVGCYECLDDFSCPYEAIVKDPRTFTVIIDQDKCVQCMRCIDQFECPEDAFTTEADEVAPAAIDTLSVVSDSIGVVQISFIATGDDGSEGLAFRYALTLRDSLNHPVAYDFELPMPSPAGFEENWSISGLPQNAALTVELEAFDEADHTSGIVAQAVVVAGEIIDNQPPAAIGDLDAISAETSITLSWTAVGDDGDTGMASGYDIRYSSEPLTAASWTEATQYSQIITPAAPGTAEELIITDLPLQEEFYFGIRAFDEVHNYATISNVVQAQIIGDIVAPDAIDDLTVASLSMNSMLISWTAVGDDGNTGMATAYEVKVHTEAITAANWDAIVAYPQQLQPLAPGETESLLIEGLDAVTLYYAAVKAIDDAANASALSNVVQGETTQMPDTTPPATITDLAAAATQDDITLSWTAPGDDGNEGTAVSYEIRVSQNEITAVNWEAADILPNPPAPQIAGTQQSYTTDYAQSGIQYYFAIRATDDSQNSAEVSNNAAATLLDDTIAPAAINDLDAAAGSSDVTLSWTAVGDDGTTGLADHYQIRSATAPITEANWDAADILPNPPIPADPGTAETYSVTGLTMGVDYYFGIKAFDEVDNASALSNIAQATIVEDLTPPSTVSDLAVTTGLAVNISTIRLSWTAPGDDGTTGTATAYDIRYSDAPITAANWDAATVFANPPAPQAAGTTQTCDVSGLESAEVIYFAIRTTDDNGNTSDISNSPAGKIVYQINRPPCNGCGHCVSHCPEDAITDHGSYATIDPDLCEACGDCVMWCPRNAIKVHVVEY
jgi:ferredoxin